jgi:hypothetical protein
MNLKPDYYIQINIVTTKCSLLRNMNFLCILNYGKYINKVFLSVQLNIHNTVLKCLWIKPKNPRFFINRLIIWLTVVCLISAYFTAVK